MRNLSDIAEEYDFLEPDERYRLLIDLGRALPPMPDALKTDATLVRGCSASVWVYPVTGPGDRLDFLADSNAAAAFASPMSWPACTSAAASAGSILSDRSVMTQWAGCVAVAPTKSTFLAVKSRPNRMSISPLGER